MLTVAGDQVPIIAFVEVPGKTGATAPLQSVVGKLNVGVTLLPTVNAIVSVIVAPQVLVAVNVSVIT